MSALSKLQTLRWYLQRPPLYAELARRVASLEIDSAAKKAARAAQKEEGRAWCAQRVVGVGDVMRSLGADAPASFAEVHADAIAEAESAVEACPVRMGGPASLDLVYNLTLALRPGRAVETGVASGWSTLAVLLAMAETGTGSLTSVDMPYPKLDNEDWVGCAVPERLRARWDLIRLPDRDGLPRALAGGTIQLAHHDSDKSEMGRRFVYESFWDALEPGGVLISDDVEDNLELARFAARVAREPLVVAKGPSNYAAVLVR